MKPLYLKYAKTPVCRVARIKPLSFLIAIASPGQTPFGLIQAL
jgi:hypothetical protein